jgi:hypothetical protein
VAESDPIARFTVPGCRSIGSTDIAAGWDLLRAERARLDAFIEVASGSAAHDPRQWLRDTR